MNPKPHESKPASRRHQDLERWGSLARDNPHDADITAHFAKALFESVLEIPDLVEIPDLDKLRALFVAYPQDAAVRQWFGRALYSALFFEREEKEFARSDAFFQELRELSYCHPEDAGVAEPFAMALSYIHAYARQEDDRHLQAGLFRELRELSNLHPNNREVQNWLRATAELENISGDNF